LGIVWEFSVSGLGMIKDRFEITELIMVKPTNIDAFTGRLNDLQMNMGVPLSSVKLTS
jgi:hypothetical protein